MRRFNAAAIKGASRQPTMAPTPEVICAYPLAHGPGTFLTSRSTHDGIFCTAPQVPRSATDAKQIASSAVIVNLRLPNNSVNGREGAFFCAASHLCDSGTKIWIRNVMAAGAAPASTTQRQLVCVTGKNTPMTPTSTNPTLDAAPIRPASIGRCFASHTSMTSATPSAHSPPMPMAAVNRSTAIWNGDCTKKRRPVKAE